MINSYLVKSIRELTVLTSQVAEKSVCAKNVLQPSQFRSYNMCTVTALGEANVHLELFLRA
jgi:hypothetical protein